MFIKKFQEMDYKGKFIRIAWLVPVLMVATYIWLAIFLGRFNTMAVLTSGLVGVIGIIQFFRLFGEWRRTKK